VQNYAILAHASQACLGEISREASLILLERLAQSEDFGLRRQTILLASVPRLSEKSWVLGDFA